MLLALAKHEKGRRTWEMYEECVKNGVQGRRKKSGAKFVLV
jgi:hypothetical protein